MLGMDRQCAWSFNLTFEVLFSQTAEEKWAAGLITLDEMEEGRENSMRVKKEGETPTTSRGTVDGIR